MLLRESGGGSEVSLQENGLQCPFGRNWAAGPGIFCLDPQWWWFNTWHNASFVSLFVESDAEDGGSSETTALDSFILAAVGPKEQSRKRSVQMGKNLRSRVKMRIYRREDKERGS